MCDICKAEPGDIVRLDSHEAKIMVGDKLCGVENFAMSFFVSDDETPEHYIIADYWLNDNQIKDSLVVAIKFCPFCGRKLYKAES